MENGLKPFEQKEEKTMTIKEIAEGIGVSYDTINRCVKRIFPDKLQHGKKAFFDEKEVACISKELKNNTSVLSHQTVAVSATVKNTTTELEVIGNAITAFKDLQELYDRKEAEYKAIIAQKDYQLTEQKPKVDTYNRIADSSGLKTIKEVANILGYGEKTYFAILRDMGILFRDNGINLPKREYIDSGYFEVKEEPYERNGQTYLYSRVFVTAKGLLWLEKKTPKEGLVS